MYSDIQTSKLSSACRRHVAEIKEAERIFGAASADAYREHSEAWRRVTADCSRMKAAAEDNEGRLRDYFTDNHQEIVDSAANIFAASMSDAHHALEASLWESSHRFAETCDKLLDDK